MFAIVEIEFAKPKMSKRQWYGAGRSRYDGGAPKRPRMVAGAAEQAISGLVAMVTEGVMEALREQGVAPTPREMRCRRCLKMGHLARDCTDEVRCFRCHGTGHMVSVCPTPPPSDLREKIPPKKDGKKRGEESASSSSSSEEEKDQVMESSRL